MPRTTGRSGPLFPVLFRFVAILVVTLVAAAPAAAELVRGRVLDPDARPVAGADVLILRGSQVVTATKTLADGRFGPVAIAAGDYEIVAAAPGLRSRARPVAVKPGGSVEIDLTLAVTAVHESVLVSAAQVEQPLTRATDSVTVITRAEIDAQQIESVADALRIVPGLAVLASGGRGGLTSVFPRGGESDYTLVLVDGVAQNAFGGAMDFAHLSTGEIERIEVVRGPQSALYGGGAIGAIVHVITQHGGPSRVGGSFEAGGESTKRATAFTTGSREAWRWGLSLDGLTTDGDTRVLAGAGGRVFNADYTRANGAGSLSWSDSPARQVRVDARIGRSERGFPGPYGSDPLDRYDGVDLISRGITQFRSVAGTASFRAGSVTHRARATWSGAESDFVSPFGGSDDRTRRVTGRYQADIGAGRVDLSAGWEFLHERAENTFIFGEQAQAVPVKRSISGWFVESRPALGPRSFLTAGVRVERIERAGLEGDRHAPRPAFDADVVWSVNPKVSFARFLNLPEGGTWTKIRAGAGTGIKPPTAFEIASDNPGLKPERSRSLDLGIEHAFADSTVILDATWFANRYDDLIVAVGGEFAGASRYRTDNIANARARGLELGARVRPTHAVSIRGAWTILDTKILGIDGAESAVPRPYRVGDRLVRRPRHQASLEAGWSHSRATAFALITGRGKTRDLEPSFATDVFDNDGYVTVELGGSVRLARQLEVFGRVTNLFDRHYEEVFGFPAQGRSALVGVRVTGSR